MDLLKFGAALLPVLVAIPPAVVQVIEWYNMSNVNSVSPNTECMTDSVERTTPAPISLELSDARTICRGQRDHTTFEVSLKNSSDSSLNVRELEFSPSHLDWGTLSNVPILADQVSTECTALATIEIQHSKTLHGEPIESEINLLIPPGESRTFRVKFQVSPASKVLGRTNVTCHGTLVIRAANGAETQIQLAPFGSHPTGVLQLPNWGSNDRWG